MLGLLCCAFFVSTALSDPSAALKCMGFLLDRPKRPEFLLDRSRRLKCGFKAYGFSSRPL